MKQTAHITLLNKTDISPCHSERREESLLVEPQLRSFASLRMTEKEQTHKISISHFLSLLFVILISLPLIASAQAPDPAPVNTVLTNFLALLTVVIKILISSAFVVFGWGIVKLIFTTRAGDAKKIGEAKQILLWSIIGIFVLASLGGIIIFIQTYFGIPNNAPIQPPTFTTFLTSWVSLV